MCGLEIWLYLRFHPLHLKFKHLNSLTTIDTFSWLCGPEVMHLTGVWEFPPGSIPGSGKDFYVWFSVLLLFFLFCPKHIICDSLLFRLQC